MIVMDIRSKHRAVNKPQHTYLFVSRVISHLASIALHPLTSENAAWSKPSASTLHEDVRLNRLRDFTLATFHSSLAAAATTTTTAT
jgi:hypothetical protein